MADVEERVARFGLEEPQRIGGFASEAAVGEVDRIELPALDLGMHAALVEVFRKAYRVFVECLRMVGDPPREVPDLVACQVGFVVEVVALLGLEPAEEIGCQCAHEPLVGDLRREIGRDHERFVLRFVADDMHGERFDTGIFGVEHFADFFGAQRCAFFPDWANSVSIYQNIISVGQNVLFFDQMFMVENG